MTTLPKNDHFTERQKLEYELTSNEKVSRLLFLIDCEHTLENAKAFKEGIFIGIVIVLVGWIGYIVLSNFWIYLIS